MPAPTCVIYNPAAGRGKTEKVMRELAPSFGKEIELRPTQRPGHAVDLAREAAGQGFAKVIAAGGDGTVHEVANGILESDNRDVVFTTWPVGSSNDYAYTLGLQEWWRRRDEQLQTEVMTVDVGRATGGGKSRYFVNGFGVGFNGMVTIEAEKTRWLRGLTLYTWALLKAMVRHFATPRMRVCCDDVEYDGPTLSLSAFLGQREGGFPLRPHAKLDDGLFDYLHATDLRRRHLLRYLPAMATGNLPENHPLIRLGQAKRIAVSAETPLCVHTDGEFFCRPGDGVTEVQAELIPNRLKVEVFRPGLYGGRAFRS